MQKIYAINSQLIYGVPISESFADILNDINHEYDNNHFFKVDDNNMILGIHVPHHIEKINPQTLLSDFLNIQQKIHKEYINIFDEIKDDLQDLAKEKHIEAIDYSLIKDEMKELIKETPHLYLYSTNQPQTLH